MKLTLQVKFWLTELAKEVEERLLKDKENVCNMTIFLDRLFFEEKNGLLLYTWHLFRCLCRHKTLTVPQNIKTIQHFQKKLGTHVYTKSHYSGFNN